MAFCNKRVTSLQFPIPIDPTQYVRSYDSPYCMLHLPSNDTITKQPSRTSASRIAALIFFTLRAISSASLLRSAGRWQKYPIVFEYSNVCYVYRLAGPTLAVRRATVTATCVCPIIIVKRSLPRCACASEVVCLPSCSMIQWSASLVIRLRVYVMCGYTYVCVQPLL